MNQKDYKAGKCKSCGIDLYLNNDDNDNIKTNVGYYRGRTSRNNLCVDCTERRKLISVLNEIAIGETKCH